MTQRHKKLDKLESVEQSEKFFKDLDISEVRLYAGILKTSLSDTKWEFSDKPATKDDIIEEMLDVMFGEDR